MRVFKLKMVRTYTTVIEVEAETKNEVLAFANYPEHYPEQSEELWERLGNEERDQDNMSKAKFTIREILPK